MIAELVVLAFVAAGLLKILIETDRMWKEKEARDNELSDD